MHGGRPQSGERALACGVQDLPRRGRARGPRRRTDCLRRELRARGGGQDPGTGRSAQRARMALHRPSAEQQDAARGRAFRLGAQRRSPQDRRAPGRAAAGASAAASGVPAGQRGRRRQQIRRAGRGGPAIGAGCGGLATLAAARADGDPGAGAGFRGAARGVPACGGAFRDIAHGGPRARHAFAGHVGRPRSRGRGRQHDGAGGDGDLRGRVST